MEPQQPGQQPPPPYVPGYPPVEMTSDRGPWRGTPYVVLAFIVALPGAYLLVGFLTRDKWAGSKRQDVTHVALSAQAQSGSDPTPDALFSARDVLETRLGRLGLSGATVDIRDTKLVITVPSTNVDEVPNLIQIGKLYIRPVIDSVLIPPPGQTSPETPPVAPPPNPATDRASEIKREQLIRQTPALEQLAALGLMRSRCEGPDVLTGNDDPTKPLVTCSKDKKQIYILEPSIISGDQIAKATSGFDQQGSQWVVNVTFKSAAANTWADYTAAHLGTATAFTLDSHVVSAPVIREAIPGGNTQITGDFTEDAASDLAGTLGAGALPLSLSVESTSTEAIPASRGWTSLRVGLLAAGIIVALLVTGLLNCLIRRRSASGGDL